MKLILYLSSRIPFFLIYIISDFLFIIIYRLFRYRKKVVISNLRKAFPNKSDLEIDTIVKDFYKHFCDLLVESLKYLTYKQLKKRVFLKNPEFLEELESLGQDVIGFGSHYGNFEWAVISRYFNKFKGVGVYQKLSSKILDKAVKKYREQRSGGLLIERKQIAKLILRKKKDLINYFYIFFLDQSPQKGKEKFWGFFFGVKTPMHIGVAAIATKTNIPSVFVNISKIKRGYYTLELEWLAKEPLKMDKFQLTQLYFNKLEKIIRNNPAYYFWTHRRWKYSLTEV